MTHDYDSNYNHGHHHGHGHNHGHSPSPHSSASKSVQQNRPWRRNSNRPPSKFAIPSPPPRHNRLHYSKPRQNQSAQRHYGYLKWFDVRKSFGYIRCSAPSGEEKELFVHESAFIKLRGDAISNAVGEAVRFSIESYCSRRRGGTTEQKAVRVERCRGHQYQTGVNPNSNATNSNGNRHGNGNG